MQSNEGNTEVILSSQSILKRCTEDTLISPWRHRCVHSCGMSYGLSSAGYDVRLGRMINVPPKSFTLGATLETFNLPLDLLMRVHDKSTWARKGLFVQNTVAEPGWRGYLTLEISNETSDWIFVEEGTPIAQVIFELLDYPTVQPYSGKYQDQEAGPQAARLENVK